MFESQTSYPLKYSFCSIVYDSSENIFLLMYNKKKPISAVKVDDLMMSDECLLYV